MGNALTIHRVSLSTSHLVILLLAIAVLPAAAALPKSGRSPVIAKHGIVAASHPLAAQIGLDILKSGGNAIDAAIATNAALCAMEPTTCGIGGDLYALVWDAKTQKLYALNASGRAPLKSSREVYAAKGLKSIPESGPLSWSVPGCVDGWAELNKRFGKKTLAEILTQPIRYAEEGSPIPEVIAGYWRSSERRLRQDPGSSAVFLPDGKLPRAGELFKNPALAKALRLISEKGRDAYYNGPIAENLVALSDKVGGLFSLDDFHKHTSTWVEPVSTTYRGYEVWEIPPPCQGIATLQMLNLLEPFDLKKMGANSADFWHVFLEAKKVAFADRGKYYADPAFAKVPVAELIAKPYADERRKLIDLAKAATIYEAGDPRLSTSETIYLCAVDDERNCVSLIQSNYSGFGSGVATAEFGFGIQNRGCLFSLDPNHANTLEPGKRPFHTIIPSFVTKDKKPWFTFGVMGGDMQPQGQVEVLTNLIDFGMDVQTAGEAPRLEHTGSPTPTSKPGAANGGSVKAEAGIPDAVIAELKKRGHIVDRVNRNSGGYQGIRIDWEKGTLAGGSEARKDGAAVGY
jgi:gamma-glutamyltranspeptidase/glutathione hydrolase